MSQSSSPGPQRTHRSPVRHSPYDYSGVTIAVPMARITILSSAPFSSLQNHDVLRRIPALTTVNIDELSTEYGLDNTQRKAAHGFSKLCTDDCLAMTFLHLQCTKQQNGELQNKITALQSHLEAINAFCVVNWKPSETQVKLLKSLLRHYIIWPITSYSTLVAIVESYIHDHAKRLHLELDKHDPTVKSIIHDLLMVENGHVRSAMRKLIFTSVKEKTPLMTFSKKTMKKYHLPTTPEKPPQDIMACLALMREVARPLAHKKFACGGDSGFWAKVENELDNLFETNGNIHGSPAWAQWEQQIIEDDNSRYDRVGTETSALNQAEIDAATSSGTTTPAADEEEDDGTEDRNANLDSLGDLAARGL
ncbi:hypothetical protein DFH08DRAFT_959738 [Mycena albidolilacea]|uniref:Uncharacterized protein n=1 Tax=Mycena albidolilacea TaxID=1033008 RepID=A0AAD7A304_9AGAR|nr:hypothetical protein DFH08DRAFT_959738 [Mycena albidolilacea]